jgi:hypothetical protein
MAKRFVQAKKVAFESDTAEKMQLIFGDEVNTVGPLSGASVKVQYRGRTGTLPKEALGTREGASRCTSSTSARGTRR